MKKIIHSLLAFWLTIAMLLSTAFAEITPLSTPITSGDLVDCADGKKWTFICAPGNEILNASVGNESTYPNYWAGITEGAGDAVGTGATLYLSPSGNDTNPCTELSPCLTPNHIDDVVAAGDTVIFEDGTYAHGESEQWRITAQGTQLQPIVYKARNPRMAIIEKPITGAEATIQMGIYSGGWLLNNDFWTVFDGLTIKGGSSHALSVTGSNHVTVKNSDIGFSGHDPIKNNSGSSYNLYFNNRIHDSGLAGAGNSEGIDITSSSYVILRQNSIYNITDGHAYYFKKVSQYCLSEYNHIYDIWTKSGGALGESVQNYDSVIRYNKVDGTGESGAQTFGAKGGFIHNNTFYDAGTNAGKPVNERSAFRASSTGDGLQLTSENPIWEDNGYLYSRNSENVNVRDNIFVVNHDIAGKAYLFDTGDGGFEPRGGASTDQVQELTTNNNLYFNRGAATDLNYNWKGHDESGLTAWQVYTRVTLTKEQEINSIEADPLFLSTVRGNANYMAIDNTSPAWRTASQGANMGAVITGLKQFGANW